MMQSSASRRQFLGTTLSACLASAFASAQDRPRRIMLKSSWQTVNIGDIAHTPGVLTLLQKQIPSAEIILWPNNVDNGVEEMLRRNFPKVRIVKGGTGADGEPATPELRAAFDEADFLLHGSGPSLVAQKFVAAWRKETGKPYGVYGITFSSNDPVAIDLLTNARFAYFRDSVSLATAMEKGVTCPIMEFGPDGAFAVALRNDTAAKAFLETNALTPGKFLCCIPRLRYTPYWKIHGKEMKAEDHRKHARNEEMKEHDHAPLRAAISAVVRETDTKVLLCPEDQSQMAIGKEMLFDPLPDAVKRRVVWREKYWLTDEALSTYALSAGLFGLEMHSPIMCIGNGIPAIVCRFEEQTSKGIMWRDIGLNEWLFDMDKESDVARIVPTVLELAKAPDAARAKVNKARAFVEQRQRETMAQVAKAAGVRT
jgi:polysaccharide pyruvyl transferase WcaK-like protein